MRAIAVAVATALAFTLMAPSVKAPAPAPLAETAAERSLALIAAQNPHGIGTKVNDKRRLSAAQRLAILRAQVADPYRDLGFDAELRAEIERLERRLKINVAKEGR